MCSNFWLHREPPENARSACHRERMLDRLGINGDDIALGKPYRHEVQVLAVAIHRISSVGPKSAFVFRHLRTLADQRFRGLARRTPGFREFYRISPVSIDGRNSDGQFSPLTVGPRITAYGPKPVQIEEEDQWKPSKIGIEKYLDISEPATSANNVT